jgi:hypothetical protein
MPRSLFITGACGMVALLSACGPAPTDPGPGGVSVEDAEALDQAAEKLDEEQANPPLLPMEAEKE